MIYCLYARDQQTKRAHTTASSSAELQWRASSSDNIIYTLCKPSTECILQQSSLRPVQDLRWSGRLFTLCSLRCASQPAPLRTPRLERVVPVKSSYTYAGLWRREEPACRAHAARRPGWRGRAPSLPGASGQPKPLLKLSLPALLATNKHSCNCISVQLHKLHWCTASLGISLCPAPQLYKTSSAFAISHCEQATAHF